MMKYGHGGDIYTYRNMLDFSVNINPLGPPKRVTEAAKRGVELMAAYPDSQCRKLREKLARKQNTPEDNYIFGNGAAELIYTLVLAERPERALIPVPAFSEYEQALETVGCEIIYHKTKENNFFCIDESFLDELDESLDIVFLCSPVNPSGHVINKELIQRTAERCENLGIRLVLDECFVEFLPDPGKYSMISEADKYRQLFILRAFTKIYAMPGLRLGYGISSDSELLEAMGRMRQPWSVSIPAQEAGAAALDEDDYVVKARELVAGEREYLEAELYKIGMKYISSDINFILLYTEINLFDAMKDRGILIRNCENYRGLGKGWYRIAVRTHEENSSLMNTLRAIVGGNNEDKNKTERVEDDR